MDSGESRDVELFAVGKKEAFHALLPGAQGAGQWFDGMPEGRGFGHLGKAAAVQGPNGFFVKPRNVAKPSLARSPSLFSVAQRTEYAQGFPTGGSSRVCG